MAILVFGVPILVGFVAGYFLSLYALIAITVLCIVYGTCLVWSLRGGGLASMVGDIFIGIAIIGNSSMWITYYFSAHQTFIGSFLHTYVLR